MDKNFVNIDDLVRQRLLGGEEREPAGAWLRMSELLEKDMPVRPAGFGWRRMFGGMAVLLLIGGLGLGGYKMSSFRSLNGTDGTVAGTAAVSHNENAPVSNNSINNTENNTTVASTAGADDNTTGREATAGVAHKNHKANHTNNTNNNSDPNSTQLLASNSTKAEDIHHQLTGAYTANKVAHTENGNVKAQSDATTNANNSIAAADQNTKSGVDNSKAVKTSGDKLALNGNTGTNMPDGVKNTVAEKSAKNDHAGQSAKSGKAAKATNGVAKSGQVASVTTTNTVGIAGNTATENEQSAVSVKHAANKAGKKAGVSSIGKHDVAKNDGAVAGMKPNGKQELTGNEAPSKEAIAKNKAGDNVPAATANEAGKKDIASTTKHHSSKSGKHTTNATVGKSGMILSSGAPVVKAGTTDEDGDVDMASVPGTTKASGTGHHAINNKMLATAGKKAIASNVTPAKTGNKSSKAGQAGAGHPKGTPGAGGITGGAKVAAVTPPVQRGKHVIQRLIVNQRLVPCGIHQSILELDTVSMENVTEEYDLAAAKPATNENSGAAKSDQVDDTSPIITTNDRFGSDVKEKGFKSKGSMALEGLNAAFNDIKYKAGHAVFNMGITGGINGTFFGPNNFKGFQFGVTGKLSFTDELALMGEFKYFNRINNNYNLNDDHYQYTAAPGGYSKELVKSSYGISTLQSIELPITVQYTKEKFSFMLGPNFSYAFGINSGEYSSVAPTNTPVIVPVAGNDNTGKIKAGDFNPRFGVGYLLGVSLQLSPKVNLDLRDVQTFWDNSKTTGSKYISSQLYRSPSFQLSIGYRFGRDKRKD